MAIFSQSCRAWVVIIPFEMEKDDRNEGRQAKNSRAAQTGYAKPRTFTSELLESRIQSRFYYRILAFQIKREPLKSWTQSPVSDS